MRALPAEAAPIDRASLQKVRKTLKRCGSRILSGLWAKKASLHQRKGGIGIRFGYEGINQPL